MPNAATRRRLRFLMVLREQPRFSGLAEIKRVTRQSPPPADTRIRLICPIGPIREDRQPPNAKCCHTKATAVSDGVTRAASILRSRRDQACNAAVAATCRHAHTSYLSYRSDSRRQPTAKCQMLPHEGDCGF